MTRNTIDFRQGAQAVGRSAWACRTTSFENAAVCQICVTAQSSILQGNSRESLALRAVRCKPATLCIASAVHIVNTATERLQKSNVATIKYGSSGTMMSSCDAACNNSRPHCNSRFMLLHVVSTGQHITS